MGEVYRARDIRLDRSVALKVLPPGIAGRADLRTRFEREARAISALNHPNICTLFDVGGEGETSYLVMELIEGETLASLLQKGPLPLERVLRYGIEIAAALAAAHRHKIVHRDLKPGNIMLTRSGIKLLDFGLARLQETPPVASHDAPTAMNPLTAEGTIVGTLQYMAPEQLEGRSIDERTDLFALGCILYEMATGHRAFDGSSSASIITSIMSAQPAPMTSVTPVAPASLERLVAKCLEKSADDRWQSASDLAIELRWIAEGSGPSAVQTKGPRSTRAAWLVALLACVGAAVFAILWVRRPHDETVPLRSTLPLVAERLAEDLLRRPIAISPDGRYLAYTATVNGKPMLWLRSFIDGNAAPVPGSEGAVGPFWSPDSGQIGFLQASKLVSASRQGGPISAICDVSPGANTMAAWTSHGTIIFSELTTHRGLQEVPASGGTPRPLGPPPPSRGAILFPQLADRDHLVYCTVLKGGDLRLHLLTLDSGRDRDLGDIESRVEIVGNEMLFVRDGSLFAQRIDTDFHRIGEPALIASEVATYATLGTAVFTACPFAVVYAGSANDSRLTWFDRHGNVLSVFGPNNVLPGVRISHDGRRVAIAVTDARLGTGDLWSCDLARNTAIRLTSTRLNEGSPVWSPDDRTIAYSYELDGPPHLFTMPAGGGEPTMITPIRGIQYVSDWTPDGRFLAFSESSATTKRDIWLVSPKPGAQPVPWLKTPFFEGSPRVSPDGRWMAYVSDASGQTEIYVAPFDRPNDALQVSRGGGRSPVWAHDGGGIFYGTSDRAIYSVKLRTKPSLDADPPVLLFRNSEGEWSQFDVAPGDDKFLSARTLSGPETRPLNLVANWLALAPPVR
jgi:serine/threonine protein kinase/Tol biopolymer transport system component